MTFSFSFAVVSKGDHDNHTRTVTYVNVCNVQKHQFGLLTKVLTEV